MHTSKDAEPHNQSTMLDQTLQFVAVHPNTRKRWLGSTRVVRSNAAQHQWKQFKEMRPRGRKSKVLPQSAERRDISVPNADAGQLECVTIDEASHSDLALPESAQLISTRCEVTDASLRYSPRSIAELSYHPYPSTLPTEIVVILLTSS